MRKLTANTTLERPPVLAEDRVLTLACVECGASFEALVPAGTPEAWAHFPRVFSTLCEDCLARSDARAEAEERERLHAQRLESSQLPVGLRGLTWDSYDLGRRGARGALAAAQEWVERERAIRAAGPHARGRAPGKPGVLLWGDWGVGKTRLAATATWMALAHFPVRWVSVPELIVSVSAGFGDAGRAEALRALTGKGPLVLDDLDKVKPSAWVLSNLFVAIDRRVQAAAPLFVTTNMDPRTLRQHLAGTGDDERAIAAEAIMSRLLGHCRVGQLAGPDGRRG